MDTATLLRVANFDQATANQLAADTGSLVEAVSAAGALSLNAYVTELTVSGTKAYTLAAPTFAGQRKLIRCVAATSSPAGTVTISSPDTTTGFVLPSAIVFDDVGQELELQATSGLLWRCIRKRRSGGAVDGVVVQTTVLTGVVMRAIYYLSVTGTASSTGTKGIPDGQMAGEVIRVSVSTAASIPSGTISITGVTSAGAAATTLGTVGATANFALLMWTGTAWSLMNASTLALS